MLETKQELLCLNLPVNVESVDSKFNQLFSNFIAMSSVDGVRM